MTVNAQSRPQAPAGRSQDLRPLTSGVPWLTAVLSAFCFLLPLLGIVTPQGVVPLLLVATLLAA